VRYVSTEIQTLNPPAKTLNLPDTANIAIVALFGNTGDNRASDDSTLFTSIAMSLKKHLEASPKYESYIFPVYSLNAEELTGERIDEVKSASDADYIIAVEKFSVNFSRKRISTSAYTQVALVAKYDATFGIYDTRTPRLLDEGRMNDTLLLLTNIYPWENEDEVVLPDKKEAASIVGKKITELYAREIAPFWREETRYYYIGPGIQSAEMYIDRENWPGAMNVWANYVDDSDRALAAASCFNMALGCEMIGEYELALKGMETVKRKTSSFHWDEYRKTLERRIAEKEIINNIMNH
jgi:hypothetical protein